MKKDLLVEIGVEEIPAGYIGKALAGFRDLLCSDLENKRLNYNSLKSYSTPRRLALVLKGLETKQEDRNQEKIGPALDTAYDRDGNLTRAAEGFLRGAGATADDIYEVNTPKGRKIAVRISEKGRETSEILKEVIPGVLRKINFPKTMRWISQDFLFARPVRWLVILFGDQLIDPGMEEVRSVGYSYGNRYQNLAGKFDIDSPENYGDILRRASVIVDRKERKKLIREQLEQLFSEQDRKVLIDQQLLEEVTDLVEYPTAVPAGFDRKYLDLPPEIVITTLSKHQKYFAVIHRDSDKLTNDFVFISNGDPACSELIRLGNEKVVKARLDDAEFYYREDLKKPLDTYLEKLKQVTFQEKLGTVYDKTLRIVENARYIAENLDLGQDLTADLLRAAQLCKTDLVTLMLGEKEFTKLQGYIGMEYARAGGEKDEVARAIFEHYLPRGRNDALPGSVAGAVVAVADKIDTVCGVCAAGLLPTGSNDPFALRRAGNGIVRIIAAQDFELDLKDLIDNAFRSLKQNIDVKPDTRDFVHQFMKQRVNWLLRESGIDYDIIESVMHIDYSRVVDLVRRAGDLQKFKQNDGFIKLVLGFKRVSNIISEYRESGNPDPELFDHETETELFRGFRSLESEISELLKVKDYQGIMAKLVDFGILIDRFFDDVLVNTDIEKLRINRYNLLAGIRRLFLKVADLAKIVVEGSETKKQELI